MTVTTSPIPAAAADRRRAGRLSAPPLPRAWSQISPAAIWTVVAGVGSLVAGLWVGHGGLTTLVTDPVAAIGQLTALGGTYAALVGILFASRAPWLDQVLGADRLRAAHRVLGFTTAWAIGAHVVLSTLAWAGNNVANVGSTLVSMLQTVPGMLGAVVGTILLGVVTVTSMRAVRRRSSYESWHAVHLYSYLAMAFGYLHQLAVGTDFENRPLGTAAWIAIYAAAFLPLLVHRVAWPVYTALRHRPRVAAVIPEGEGVFSLVVEGDNLDRLAVRSGQFFVVRALTRRDWNHGHPFSISAAPNGRAIRFTIKEAGEGTRALRSVAVGTPLLLEGPYGNMTGARRTEPRVLLIAAGIGVAPIRALAEGLPYGRGDADLLYRTRSVEDAPLAAELAALAQHRGLRLHLLGGRREEQVTGDPLGAASIVRLVPDVATRDVYLCGPVPVMERTRAALLSLGTPAERIHMELFWPGRAANPIPMHSPEGAR